MAGLRAFIRLAILAPIAAAVIIFAIANRAPVTVSFDPVSREAPIFALAMPLYLLVLIAIGLGVVAGGLGAWLAQGRHRKAERAHRREAQALRGEAERLRAALAERPALPAP